MNAINDVITYKYKFVFDSGAEKIFEINLEPDLLTYIRNSKKEPPEWTKCEGLKCNSLCGFIDKHCPIMVNIEELIDSFSDHSSFENVKIFVEVNSRTYIKETSLQDGVGSLMGIIMVSSGCPVLSKLKPMVRYHLPFALIEETEFRVISMFLLAQYLRKRRGLNPDWELNELKKVYSDIREINKSLAQRIANVEKMDTGINAVVILDNFANLVTIDLDEDELSHIESLFKEWLGD
jgi:hypothetical protein